MNVERKHRPRYIWRVICKVILGGILIFRSETLVVESRAISATTRYIRPRDTIKENSRPRVAADLGRCD